MRTCFAIFLLTVGCMSESNGSTAEATQPRSSLGDSNNYISGDEGFRLRIFVQERSIQWFLIHM
jgi:hypothetical protein